MNQVVEAAFAKVNPGVKFAHLGHGGMSASSARDKYLEQALQLRPSHVLIVVVIRSDADAAAMEEMTRRLTAAGAKVACFDQLHPDKTSWVNPDPAKLDAAVKAGLAIIPVADLISTHPDRSKFICLDGVHMTDPWHKMMAAVWVKWVVEGGEK
jgi:hypothetical protein